MMTRLGQRLLAMLLVSVTQQAACVAIEDRTDTGLSERLGRMVRLRGKRYVAARSKVLQEHGVRELENTAAASKQWDTGLLCDALAYRKRQPELAALLDGFRSGQGLGTQTPARLRGSALRGSYHYARAVVTCFGPESFPVVAENILFAWENGPVEDAVLALSEMRDTRAVDVLLTLVKDQQRGASVRAHAALAIESYLIGLPAWRRAQASKVSELGIGLPLPKELAHLAKPVDLPAVRLKGLLRSATMAELCGVLGSDPDPRVRALAARALCDPSTRIISALGASLGRDASPWVRAWCARALRRIGTGESYKALEVGRKANSNADVLKAIAGKAVPALPELGVPKGTILSERK